MAERGAIPSPPGLSAGDGFGYDIVAPGPHIPFDNDRSATNFTWNPEYPAEVRPYRVNWVAVGAPGVGDVHIYEVDSTSSTPFTWVQTLSGPGNFGHSLAVGKLNSDDWPDLVVGAPTGPSSNPGGVVRVYWGRDHALPLHTTPTELSTADFPLLALAGSTDDFGFDVATGDLVSGSNSESVIIGVPGYDGNRGRVCHAKLQDSGAPGSAGTPPLIVLEHMRCDQGGYSFQRSGDRLGESVAVGNFINSDNLGNFHEPPTRTNSFAYKNEVVAGVPHGSRWGTNQGYLMFFGADADGMSSTTFFDPAYGATGAVQQGTSLATGAIHTNNPDGTVSHWTDLIVGGRNGAWLTKGTGLEDCTDEAYGLWDVLDDNGTVKRVRIWRNRAGQTVLNFPEGFFAKVNENFGDAAAAECEFDDGDGTTFTSLPIPPGTTWPLQTSPSSKWTCGGPPAQPYIGVSFDPIFGSIVNDMGSSDISPGHELDVTVQFAQNASASRNDDTISLTFDISTLNFGKLGIDNECRIVGPLGGGRFQGTALGPVVE